MDRFHLDLETGINDILAEPLALPLAAPVAARSAENDPWIASLRLLLEASATPLSECAAASALGVSARTLQRHLRSLGTTFRRERSEARRRAGA